MSNLKQIYAWIKKQKKKQKIIVKEKNISKLDLWKCNSDKIYHNSKKFFSIVGLRIISNFYKHYTWDQPLIYQNENGILGIVIAGMLAAFMSTHDSYLLCWSTIITNDIIDPLMGNNLSSKEKILHSRYIIILLGF